MKNGEIGLVPGGLSLKANVCFLMHIRTGTETHGSLQLPTGG